MCFRVKEFLFGLSLAEGVAAIGFAAGFCSAYIILVYLVLIAQSTVYMYLSGDFDLEAFGKFVDQAGYVPVKKFCDLISNHSRWSLWSYCHLLWILPVCINKHYESCKTRKKTKETAIFFY
jgi:uncharacterized membrane protein